METWKAVVGFEGYYEVSDEGRVRSLNTTIWALNRWGRISSRKLVGRIMSPLVNSQRGGYRYFNLHKEGSQTLRRAAVLVAAAFLGPRPTNMEVAHENGNPSDDRASNLVYKTKKENAADRERHGTQRKGENHPNVKLSSSDISKIRELAAGGATHSSLGFIFGVSQQHVTNVVLKKRRAHA